MSNPALPAAPQPVTSWHSAAVLSRRPSGVKIKEAAAQPTEAQGGNR